MSWLNTSDIRMIKDLIQKSNQDTLVITSNNIQAAITLALSKDVNIATITGVAQKEAQNKIDALIASGQFQTKIIYSPDAPASPKVDTLWCEIPLTAIPSHNGSSSMSTSVSESESDSPSTGHGIVIKL